MAKCGARAGPARTPQARGLIAIVRVGRLWNMPMPAHVKAIVIAAANGKIHIIGGVIQP